MTRITLTDGQAAHLGILPRIAPEQRVSHAAPAGPTIYRDRRRYAWGRAHPLSRAHLWGRLDAERWITACGCKETHLDGWEPEAGEQPAEDVCAKCILYESGVGEMARIAERARRSAGD